LDAAAAFERPEVRVTVSTLLVRALVDAAERSGVPRETLLEGTLEASRLADIGARIDLAGFERLQLRALDLTRNEALPLQMGEWVSEGTFDVVAHMISHSPSLRQAIDLSSRFGRLIIDGNQLHLRERGSDATLVLEFARTSPRMDRAHAEFVLVGLLRMLQMFGGPATRVFGVHFEHERPGHHRQYTRVFSGAERFAQTFTGIVFDATLLDRPYLHQHSQLYDLLWSQAESQLGQLSGGGGVVPRLEEYLLARPATRIPDMQTAARAQGISVRSLRRRLTEAGLSYRGLVQSVLERRATRLLRDMRHSIQDVAAALGFADATSFHRAFKRWTGLTPLEFRETATEAEDPAHGPRSSADGQR
jgi:AraC-like DNA-binding protein